MGYYEGIILIAYFIVGEIVTIIYYYHYLQKKFQHKILPASHGKKQRFVISFMGTSVTAGHDSPFNLSYPVLVGKLLAPPLRSLGVQVVTLNAS